jgi:hypothetical protein
VRGHHHDRFRVQPWPTALAGGPVGTIRWRSHTIQPLKRRNAVPADSGKTRALPTHRLPRPGLAGVLLLALPAVDVPGRSPVEAVITAIYPAGIPRPCHRSL